jgi:hypothetical protein
MSDDVWLAIIIGGAVVTGIVASIIEWRKTRVTKKRTRLHFLNFLGGDGERLLNEDRAAIARFFGGSTVPTTPEKCELLFLYCEIDNSGRIAGWPDSLRDVIQATGAQIVVIGSPNPPDHYIAATKNPRHGFANLVMTLDRRGAAFPAFFGNLFSRMRKTNESMPVAWNEIAMQYPGADHGDAPDTIMLAELGQVRI